jgi:uncharacterized CHY-type Zn-finger protein
MVEDIHLVLCALMGLCIDSDNIASPQLLEHIADYAQCVPPTRRINVILIQFRTLQKFHACLKAQKELGNLKRLFKQSEITQQLNTCKRDLSNACNIFTVGHFENVSQQI